MRAAADNVNGPAGRRIEPYTHAMRRFLAITLLIAFGFLLLSAFVGLRAQGQSTLPACCRRGGAHHCSGGTWVMGGGPALSSIPCPYFPAVEKAVRTNDTVVPVVRDRRGDTGCSDETTALGERGRVASGSCAAHLKRGPPVQLV
ncbi:MAG: hypothetical protein NVSMB62_20300 [Acidobacteriaceae bacterium]